MKRVAWLTFLLAVAAHAGQVEFRKTIVDRAFRSEGVAAADVNRDGRLDILAGDVWYAAPDWAMHEVRPARTYDGAKEYSRCFYNFATDVNGDGWADSVVVNNMGGACTWYENPKGRPGHWRERVLWRNVSNETPMLVDLLGTGKPVMVFAIRPEARMVWLSIPADPEKPWDVHPISATNAPGTSKYSHGLGVGDIDGDGRRDVVVRAGWWQAPEDRTQPDWPFHRASLGHDCSDMLVYDFDGDGDSDVATSSAHRRGIWWHEQVRTDKGIAFREHEVSKAISQTHAMQLADVDGDGLADLVTGKRYFAHMGRDPGAGEPALLVWFQLRRPVGGGVEFVQRLIDGDSGIGTQFAVRDMNGDGKTDVLVSNKKGVHVHVQQ